MAMENTVTGKSITMEESMATENTVTGNIMAMEEIMDMVAMDTEMIMVSRLMVLRLKLKTFLMSKPTRILMN